MTTSNQLMKISLNDIFFLPFLVYIKSARYWDVYVAFCWQTDGYLLRYKKRKNLLSVFFCALIGISYSPSELLFVLIAQSVTYHRSDPISIIHCF